MVSNFDAIFNIYTINKLAKLQFSLHCESISTVFNCLHSKKYTTDRQIRYFYILYDIYIYIEYYILWFPFD